MKHSMGLMAFVVLIAVGLIMAGRGTMPDGLAHAGTPAAAMGVNMKEGKWEVTSTVEMKGMPPGVMKPHIYTSCLKQNDYVPKNESEKDCTMKDMKINGNTVSWEATCKDSTGKGSITYAGDTYDGKMEMFMKQGGEHTNMKIQMKGRYIGPCNK